MTHNAGAGWVLTSGVLALAFVFAGCSSGGVSAGAAETNPAEVRPAQGETALGADAAAQPDALGTRDDVGAPDSLAVTSEVERQPRVAVADTAATGGLGKAVGSIAASPVVSVTIAPATGTDDVYRAIVALDAIETGVSGVELRVQVLIDEVTMLDVTPGPLLGANLIVGPYTIDAAGQTAHVAFVRAGQSQPGGGAGAVAIVRLLAPGGLSVEDLEISAFFTDASFGLHGPYQAILGYGVDGF